MAIDANIIGRLQPVQAPDQMNMLARVMAIKDAQQAGQMRDLQMAEINRGIEQRNRLQNVLGQQYDKPEAREEALLRGGFVKESADLTKNRVDAAKVQADTDKNRMEAAHKRIDAWGSVMGYVRQNPTMENAAAAVQHLVQLGVIPQEMAQGALAQVQANPTPQGIAQFADLGFRAALGAKEQLAKVTTNNIGGQTITQAADPVTGRTQITGAVQNTQSPDNAATNARLAADAAAGRAVTMRGQDMTDQRQRDQNDIQKGQKSQQGVIELRKEFNALPEVKNFREVLPVITSVQRAPNTPAGDIDMIYGVGKIMDPNSVVREGEMNMVIAAGSPAQKLQGYLDYVRGHGRLTPELRQQLVQVMQSRVQGLKTNYDNARTTYETAADRGGLPKDQIFIENPVPDAPPVDLGALPSGGKGKGSGRGTAPTAQPRIVNFGDLR